MYCMDSIQNDNNNNKNTKNIRVAAEARVRTLMMERDMRDQKRQTITKTKKKIRSLILIKNPFHCYKFLSVFFFFADKHIDVSCSR